MTIILWGHALAALLFGMLAVSQLRDAATALPRLTFVVALAATALWALAVAGIDPRDVTARVAESLRNLSWLGFMFALVRRDPDAPHGGAVITVYGVVVLIVLAGIGLAVAEATLPPADIASASLASVRLLLRMMVAVSALVLVHHLYSAVAPRARGGIRLVVIALAAMWCIDLAIHAVAYLTKSWGVELVATRGVAMTLLAPLFALAVMRNGDWTLKLSRTVAWQSLSLVATILWLVIMVLITSLIAAFGGAYVRIAQTAFVLGSAATTLTLVSSPWLKGWAKVKLAKHLFNHRYDYRAEWARFTETLGKPEGAAPLDERIVKAVADLTDSPAGLLLVPDGTGLGIGAAWQWDRDGLPVAGGDDVLARYLVASGRIVELDMIRNDAAAGAEAASVPQWMLDTNTAWALVPLVHLDRLQGAILLARPALDRALDWEDFDLLRIAGRQAASYLAEARAQEALADVERFDEFNRRFAFILHDIKNLVSQLTLVARNAERHADNPEFRADMVATLKDSAGRMNDLLARLSQHHSARAEELRPVELMPLVERVAARRRAQHPVAVIGGGEALAQTDPARLEQLLGHLLQNAIEASPFAEPVTIAVSADAGQVVIDVIDRGCGMSPAFIRDKLFKPFVSSKAGGFGIGAFEARQLAQAMGGGVAVTSREGEGTRFRVTLPRVRTDTMERAA
ncbi:PEP-CTERM system histidine kinase PrsK [Sphingomonas sp. So64.6b]|uniref:XrtA/PEP-CTERM system histidine kinase PrsK n=1 Tax=Sphingomonas sp. So64.6b TaxID=2997354 RepID=UPI0016048099|nr:XrtA/PEP-CTERM system histidine kinase PrsK [Sphingomonas sp. So64.6b]QNA85032.1 PEP-CTERM system histidine kinase PrsK [Sphingomonas sp. So64.6b]